MSSAFTTFVILAGSGISGAMLEYRDGDAYDSHRGSPRHIVPQPRDNASYRSPIYTQPSLSSNCNISCDYTRAVNFVLDGADLSVRLMMRRLHELQEQSRPVSR